MANDTVVLLVLLSLLCYISFNFPEPSIYFNDLQPQAIQHLYEDSSLPSLFSYSGAGNDKSWNPLALDVRCKLERFHKSSLEKQINRLAAVKNSNIIGAVLPSDVVLVRPSSDGPILAAITAYTWRVTKKWPDRYYELPIYKVIDRDDDTYWDYLVDELLLSRVNVVLMHGRGCWDLVSGTAGTGDLCPRILSNLVRAVRRANAEDALRFGMWDDTGAYNKALEYVESLDDTPRFDISNRTNWHYFWDRNIKIWFDTIPQEWWFLMDGKPIIASWTLSDYFFSNQEGNASALLRWIKLQFATRYGIEPSFILDQKWFETDSTITSDDAVGKNGWFIPQFHKTHSYVEYNGATWGAVAPSFRDANTLPGCGDSCREVTRRNGATLIDALNQGMSAKLILLEGWTDMAESAGYYRSDNWTYPNQYINIVRRYADPQPKTLRFQAESADILLTKSIDNPFRRGDFDIQPLDDGTGWFVRFTDAGEWLQYQEIQLGCGTYRFTARVATTFHDKTLRLDLDGLHNVKVPVSSNWQDFNLVHLGEIDLLGGLYDLRIVSETGGINIDWFFVKRIDEEIDALATS